MTHRFWDNNGTKIIITQHPTDPNIVIMQLDSNVCTFTATITTDIAEKIAKSLLEFVK